MSIIHGCITALITPFKANGKLDEMGLEKLVLRQIKSGVHGIVPCGTTGESPTLSYEEHQEVIKIAIDITKRKIPVIAGTGSNSTYEALEMTASAEKAGADATLQVVPYYNKPNQIYGIADGSGDIKRDLAKSEEKKILNLKKFLNTNNYKSLHEI